MVESNIIAEGSIDSILDGHSYNRGIRMCKLVDVAWMRLTWKDFKSWPEETKVFHKTKKP